MRKPVKKSAERSAPRRPKAKKKSTAAALANRLAALEEAIDGLLREQFERFSRSVPQATALKLPAAQDRFVRATADGWLLVMMSGTKTSLPSGLKVSLTGSSGGRDDGVVSEGMLAGKRFDVTAGNLAASFRRLDSLKATVAKRAGGPVVIGGVSYELELQLAFKEAGISKSAGPFAATTDAANPISSGNHEMEIADFPHDYGSTYGPHGTVWFRIGHSGDRYVHPGRRSAGCLTCAPSQWEAIYEILNSARLDARSVGTLTVA